MNEPKLNTMNKEDTAIKELIETLESVIERIVGVTAIDCILANIKGGGTTKYIVTISPSNSGNVFVTLDCEVTPVKRTLCVVKGLDNGKENKTKAADEHYKKIREESKSQ